MKLRIGVARVVPFFDIIHYLIGAILHAELVGEVVCLYQQLKLRPIVSPEMGDCSTVGPVQNDFERIWTVFRQPHCLRRRLDHVCLKTLSEERRDGADLVSVYMIALRRRTDQDFDDV